MSDVYLALKLEAYFAPCERKNFGHHSLENFLQIIKRFVNDASGATAIEYALIAAGIGIAIITAVNALGTEISDKFNSIKGALAGGSTS